MVSETTQHYRWDFIGLSTDTKPTPATSEKVVDGSTFYCSDTSKLYVYCKDDWYERKPLGGGGGGSYTAGSGIDITGTTISVDTPTVQNNMTAFVGTDGSYEGEAGLVPAPATTDADKFLKSDGTWDTAGGGVTPVQATGDSTSDVMSQNATTTMVFNDPSSCYQIKIGDNSAIGGNGTNAVAIGRYSTSGGSGSVAIGGGGSAMQSGATSMGFGGVSIGRQTYGDQRSAIALGESSKTYSEYAVSLGGFSLVSGTNAKGSIALGAGTKIYNVAGLIQIGVNNESMGNPTDYGYGNTIYRVIRGLHDGVEAHDAATVAQGNTLATSAPTTSTVGVLGQLYTDTVNMHTYQCTAISGDTYTWTQRW